MKKTAEEILSEITDIPLYRIKVDDNGEYITKKGALLAMEEYRSQASELPSDEESNLPSFLYMNGDNQITVGVYGDSVVTDEWNQFISSRDARIKELEEWISVEDRLPEFDGKYLVFIEQEQECHSDWKYQKVVDIIFNNWVLIDREKVTHWKNLPTPPKP